LREALGAIAFSVLSILGVQQAFATTIDFDFFPDGLPVPDRTRITDQYAQCGVQQFTTEIPEGPQTFSFSEFGGSSPNQLGADGPPGNPAFTYSIGVQFVSPVSQASINALGVGFNGLILEAYNSGNVLIDSVQVINPGNPSNQVDLMTVSGSDIVSLVIKQVTPGVKQGNLIDGYVIDDLQFPGPPCELPDESIVGGQIIPIETTSLLLAGAQSTTWLIPVVVSAVGIGLVLVRRK